MSVEQLSSALTEIAQQAAANGGAGNGAAAGNGFGEAHGAANGGAKGADLSGAPCVAVLLGAAAQTDPSGLGRLSDSLHVLFLGGMRRVRRRAGALSPQQAMRAQQALGLNMGGLSLHHNNAAAAAAAAATTAALQTLARNAAASGDPQQAALGMQAVAALAANHQLPPLAPNSAALQSLSNEINASLITNGERGGRAACVCVCLSGRGGQQQQRDHASA